MSTTATTTTKNASAEHDDSFYSSWSTTDLLAPFSLQQEQNEMTTNTYSSSDETVLASNNACEEEICTGNCKQEAIEEGKGGGGEDNDETNCTEAADTTGAAVANNLEDDMASIFGRVNSVTSTTSSRLSLSSKFSASDFFIPPNVSACTLLLTSAASNVNLSTDTTNTSGGLATAQLSPKQQQQQEQQESTKVIPKRIKSVDFAISPPSKRAKVVINSPTPSTIKGATTTTRQTAPWTAKQVVDAISTSVTHHERMVAIKNAQDSFNHNIQAVHDDEFASGADAALVKHLTFLVYSEMRRLQQQGQHKIKQHKQSTDSLLTEISLTCATMESLYRASSEVVGASFRRMGHQLLDLLLTIINFELNKRQLPNKRDSKINGKTSAGRHPEESPTWELDQEVAAAVVTSEGDLLLRKAARLLGHFARVGAATKPMADFPTVLSTLQSMISVHPYDCSIIPWEARLSALWTIANLACNTENMQRMGSTPGLIQALINVSSREVHNHDALESTIEVLRSKSIASRALLNLSWSSENKIILSENTTLLDLLAEWMVYRKASFNTLRKSATVHDILRSTRQHAVGAIRNLAATSNNKIKTLLCSYKAGHLLDALTDAALNDSDAIVKDRAYAAIHNLATTETAEQIISHPALVLALKSVLGGSSNISSSDSKYEEGESKEDDDLEASYRVHAAATLLILEQSIQPHNTTAYEYLLNLVEAINPDPTPTSDALEGQDEETMALPTATNTNAEGGIGAAHMMSTTAV